jgi:hypothetical protein
VVGPTASPVADTGPGPAHKSSLILCSIFWSDFWSDFWSPEIRPENGAVLFLGRIAVEPLHIFSAPFSGRISGRISGDQKSDQKSEQKMEQTNVRALTFVFLSKNNCTIFWSFFWSIFWSDSEKSCSATENTPAN